jgi:hypothetical protein
MDLQGDPLAAEWDRHTEAVLIAILLIFTALDIGMVLWLLALLP